jgi:hypothetical protein
MNSTQTLSKPVHLPPENVVLPPDKIYNLQEASALLGCTQRKLSELFKTGKIKGTRATGQWLTSYQNIVNFINHE